MKSPDGKLYGGANGGVDETEGEMPKRAKELSALEVSKLREPGMHAVGTVPGLYLLVAPTGARSWILRLQVGTKRPEIGLGAFPAVTLAEAREKARRTRADVEAGKDPIEERRSAASALKASQVAAKTFEECAKGFIDAHRESWSTKHAKQWESSLKQHVYPKLGSVLARHVDTPMVLDVLQPIWKTITETASRVRNRMELILDWAAVMQYRDGTNPARWRGHLDKLLAAPSKIAKTKNYPAVQIHEAGAFMRDVRAIEGVSARALEMLMLTTVRSANVRLMTWREVDLEKAEWSIPGEDFWDEEGQRMKTRKDHRVPLCEAAVALLKAQPRLPAVTKPLPADKDYCFPAPKGGPLSDMALSMLMRRMDYKDKNGRRCVPHGLRSTFKDWAAERTNYPNHVSEMALAHAIGNEAEAAYRRGDLFDKRRQMMDDWGTFCSMVEAPTGTVVPLRATGR